MIEEGVAPIVYEENKVKVLEDLKDGRLDYLDLADWTFQDRFFAFLLGVRFFEICGASYPTPRKKEKRDLDSDVLMPLRSNMEVLKDPIRIAESFNYKWVKYNEYSKYGVRYTEEVTLIEDVDIWEECEVPLCTSIMRVTGFDGSVRYWGLSSTFKPKDAREAFALYELRTQIEERHRQSKKFWHINEFSSPNESLIEAHVMFTLLTYSLVQLYLNKKHLNVLANKTISSLKRED